MARLRETGSRGLQRPRVRAVRVPGATTAPIVPTVTISWDFTGSFFTHAGNFVPNGLVNNNPAPGSLYLFTFPAGGTTQQQLWVYTNINQESSFAGFGNWALFMSAAVGGSSGSGSGAGDTGGGGSGGGGGD